MGIIRVRVRARRSGSWSDAEVMVVGPFTLGSTVASIKAEIERGWTESANGWINEDRLRAPSSREQMLFFGDSMADDELRLRNYFEPASFDRVVDAKLVIKWDGSSGMPISSPTATGSSEKQTRVYSLKGDDAKVAVAELMVSSSATSLAIPGDSKTATESRARSVSQALLFCSVCNKDLDAKKFNKTQRRKRSNRTCISCWRSAKQRARDAQDVRRQQLSGFRSRDHVMAFIKADVSRWRNFRRKERNLILRHLSAEERRALDREVLDWLLFDKGTVITRTRFSSSSGGYGAVVTQVTQGGADRRQTSTGMRVAVSFAAGAMGARARGRSVRRLSEALSGSTWTRAPAGVLTLIEEYRRDLPEVGGDPFFVHDIRTDTLLLSSTREPSAVAFLDARHPREAQAAAGDGKRRVRRSRLSDWALFLTALDSIALNLDTRTAVKLPRLVHRHQFVRRTGLWVRLNPYTSNNNTLMAVCVRHELRPPQLDISVIDVTVPDHPLSVVDNVQLQAAGRPPYTPRALDVALKWTNETELRCAGVLVRLQQTRTGWEVDVQVEQDAGDDVGNWKLVIGGRS